jgi:hypothetical protein
LLTFFSDARAGRWYIAILSLLGWGGTGQPHPRAFQGVSNDDIPTAVIAVSWTTLTPGACHRLDAGYLPTWREPCSWCSQQHSTW